MVDREERGSNTESRSPMFPCIPFVPDSSQDQEEHGHNTGTRTPFKIFKSHLESLFLHGEEGFDPFGNLVSIVEWSEYHILPKVRLGNNIT